LPGGDTLVRQFYQQNLLVFVDLAEFDFDDLAR
jgi:hypothetical protein